MRIDGDALDAGVRALRVATAAAADGEATRARVLGLVERGRVRRARLRRFGVAGLALFASLSLGSAAWTALGHLRARARQTPGATDVAGAARAIDLGARKPPATPTPPSTAVAASSSGARTERPAKVVALARPTPAPRASTESETSLYARAHEAHFTHDAPAEALAAWTRYLAAYPRGAFAPDARYNRALCLLRLGQRAAAARALRPFADGEYQGYRRLEADALLDWLDRQPP